MALLLALAAAFSPAPPLAAADPLTTPTPICCTPNATVRAIALSGTTAFIGGDFTRLGTPTGGFGLLDAAATLRPGSPAVIGAVHSVVSDGAGGWFLGGTFTSVGGLPRQNLAHVLSGGGVDPAWAPSTDGDVGTLATLGTTVYAGGGFSLVNGSAPRASLALLNASTGAVLAAAPGVLRADGSQASVSSIVTVPGQAAGAPAVYVGGTFAKTADGQPRNNLAAFDSDGATTSENPPPA